MTRRRTNSVIVPQASRSYLSRMAAAFLRMVMLLAVVLMPFGMISAPAMAHAVPADQAAAAMGHCNEQQERDQAPVAPDMDCATTCGALPAAAPSSPPLRHQPITLRSLAIYAPFVGIEPEIVTPPPRRV